MRPKKENFNFKVGDKVKGISGGTAIGTVVAVDPNNGELLTEWVSVSRFTFKPSELTVVQNDKISTNLPDSIHNS